MPFTYSISVGIGAGFLAFVLLKVVRGKAAAVHPLMWVVAALFVVYFAINPITALAHLSARRHDLADHARTWRRRSPARGPTRRAASSRLVRSYSARSASSRAQVVAEREHPSDLLAAGPEDVQVDPGCLLPEQPVLVPLGLAEVEDVARRPPAPRRTTPRRPGPPRPAPRRSRPWRRDRARRSSPRGGPRRAVSPSAARMRRSCRAYSGGPRLVVLDQDHVVARVGGLQVLDHALRLGEWDGALRNS